MEYRKIKTCQILTQKEGNMGLADAFGAEDRVQVKFSDFYELVRGCVQRDQLMNAVKCDVPHRYIREMTTGKSEESGKVVEEEKENKKK